MTQFQFDTSGVVRRLNELGDESRTRPFAWSDLKPFVQGYVEAMAIEISEWAVNTYDEASDSVQPLGFRHIAPETLARIMEDCAQRQLTSGWGDQEDRRALGTEFWNRLQADQFEAFPPLTIALNDQGKVVFL